MDKVKEAAGVPPVKAQKKQDEEGCFFCGKGGHLKKECVKYKAWRVKKGKLLIYVCSEVNLTSVPKDTWWVDSGATTHVSVSMQGYLWSRKPSDDERFIYLGNGNTTLVEAIRLFRIQLETGYFLDLEKTFIVLSFR